MAEDPRRESDDERAADEDAETAPEAATASGEGDAPEHDDAGLGRRLETTREALGLSVEDVAAELKLPARTILALEADDFDHLPGPTFVRGYLRAYARLVDLPGDDLVAAHEARAGGIRPDARPSPRIETAGPAETLARRGPGALLALAAVVLIIALAALAAWSWLGRGAPQTPPAAAAEGPAPAAPVAPGTGAAGSGADAPALPVPAADPGTGAASGAPPRVDDRVAPAPAAEGPGTIPADGPSGPADSGAGVPGDAAPAPGAPEASPDAAATDAATGVEVAVDDERIRIFAGGRDHLEFRFSDECWIEIRDADDVGVHSDLHRAGEVVDVYGRAPFSVVLGYAPAVTLAYNDVPVPLAPHTRNDVASLVLGR
jgi:cytoskeleton protein RodZ